MKFHILNDEMREELVAPEPIRTKVILPLPPTDLDRYAVLLSNSELLDGEIKELERQLRLARIRKATCDVEILQILERRIA